MSKGRVPQQPDEYGAPAYNAQRTVRYRHRHGRPPEQAADGKGQADAEQGREPQTDQHLPNLQPHFGADIDHHDVSGTDSPYRETSNIYDGSRFTADMAIHNVIGDSFRGATWVSIHNGGGVGWGEVINGGFGMVLDGSIDAQRRLNQMLFWDVNNGIARRSWARNEEAVFAIKAEMQREPMLRVTLPNKVEDSLFKS